MPTFEPEELRRRVDEVLFYIWDPIGVGPSPDARHEYRSYANTVYAMIQNGDDAHKIKKYLCELESGMLSMPAKDKRAEKVVELLFAHKDAIEDGRA